MAQNQILYSLVHVNDIAPTLLELAQVAKPGSSYKGQPVQALVGRSLLPALHGKPGPLHPPEEAIGYEMSGDRAIFKGDLKLVSNLPQLGDGL